MQLATLPKLNSLKSFSLKLFLILIFLGASAALAFFIGSTEAWNNWVILESRLPHVMGALIAGSALALCGHFMQWLFRNPLAGPSVLGVTNGASLGMALIVLMPGTLGNLLGSQLIASFIGAFIVLMLMASMSKKFTNISALLIVGMLLAHLTGAIETILLRSATDSARTTFVFWGMGSLDALQPNQLPLLLLGGLAPVLPLCFYSKAMHAYALGDEIAMTSGVHVGRLRLIFFLSIGISVATITAFCGPLVFVGFVTPHLARMYVGSGSLKKLNTIVPLTGAIFLMLADVCSRYYGLPINAVLALAGLPIMIYLLIYSKYAQAWIS